MKTTLSLLVLSLLVISVIPGVLANDVGTGIGVDIITEDFEPLVWMCDNRVVYDDNTEPGRLWANPDNNCQDVDQDGEGDCELLERLYNYAFEGEQIEWVVLVMDKNGIEKVVDVYGTVGASQGAGNDIEVNCQRIGNPYGSEILPECNARILEEQLTEFNPDVMEYYSCLFTVETPDSMYGEHWLTVEAEDLDGFLGTMDENEYWFFNPIIALSVDGDLTFDNVRPGTQAYSNTLLVGNDADEGSGVMLDMFITGTDFYDSSSSAAACPVTNQLSLDAFRYFATNGAYSTFDDAQVDVVDGDRNIDQEGYVNIEYGIGFNNPDPFYDNAEILQGQQQGPYWAANTLSPGAEMAITFKLSLPEPCNGDFDSGSLYFWGEAI